MCRRTGDYSEEGTPVPIPNTKVKLFSSDDTLGVAPRENRKSPFHPLTRAVCLLPPNPFSSAHIKLTSPSSRNRLASASVLSPQTTDRAAIRAQNILYAGRQPLCSPARP